MNTSRRSFIKNSSLVVAGTTMMTGHIFTPLKHKEKLALQLYSVKSEMNNDAEGTLKALRKIGYEYVEHAGYIDRKFYGYSARDFRQLISDCGMVLLSGHAVLEKNHWHKSSDSFTKQWYQVIEDAAKVGQEYLITPWLDASLWNDEKGLNQFLEVLNLSGELCLKSGIQFGYHNHDFEFSNFVNDERLYDVILQNTDPRLVIQQLDIGNINTEYSIANLLDQYPSRFKLIHVKDILKTNARNQPYSSTIIGKGIIGVSEIIKKAIRAGDTSCFIIEQDALHDGIAMNCAQENFAAVNALVLS